MTFPLADSIPTKVLNEWRHEKANWLEAHGIEMDQRGKWMDAYLALPDAERFRFERIFNRKTNDSLDQGHGSCLLAQRQHAETLRQKLLFFNGQRYQLGDYLIMPNHVHLLVRPLVGYELEKILHSIKKESSRTINQATDRRGGLWQKDSYDHLVRDIKELRAFRKYIADNPRKAGLSPDACLHHTAEYE